LACRELQVEGTKSKVMETARKTREECVKVDVERMCEGMKRLGLVKDDAHNRDK